MIQTQPANPIRSFLWGFFTPFKAALVILKAPSLLGIVVVPLAFNAALYILFFRYGAHYLNEVIASWVGQLTGYWAVAAYWLLKFTAWVLLIVTAAISFSIISGILIAPFNDLICRRTIKIHSQNRGKSLKIAAPLPLKITLMLETKRTLLLISLGLATLIVGLVPFFQIPALVLGSWLLAFEYFGYPVSQYSGSLRAVWAFVFRSPFLSLGFGSCLLLLMAIPFASIVYIPLAVVGGTLLHEDIKSL